jgi:hypothetical protein
VPARLAITALLDLSPAPKALARSAHTALLALLRKFRVLQAASVRQLVWLQSADRVRQAIIAFSVLREAIPRMELPERCVLLVHIVFKAQRCPRIARLGRLPSEPVIPPLRLVRLELLDIITTLQVLPLTSTFVLIPLVSLQSHSR